MKKESHVFSDLVDAETRLQPIPLSELCSLKFPESKWVIESIIPHEGITILSGAPASFKTWLLLRMAMDISKGEMFLGQFPCEQSNALIIDEEDHLRIIQERLKLMRVDESSPIYFLSQKGFLVSEEEHVARILRICEEKEISTIFIDSLVRINTAEENDASQMSEVFRCIRQLCQAKKTVIITHHEKKEGVIKFSAQNRLRGSSDISAAVDAHIAIRRDKDNRNKIVIEQPKLRNGKEMGPFEVVVQESKDLVEFCYLGASSDDSSKKVVAKGIILNILDEEREGLSRSEICKRVKDLDGIGGKSTKDAMDELIQEKTLLERQGNKNTKICYLPKFHEELPVQKALV